MATTIAKAAVLWFHGLGDNGASWRWMSRAFNKAHVQWTFPTAPTMPVTVNDGLQMPSWFDMDEIPVTKATVDHAASFHESIKFVHGLIDKQVAEGIPAERIVLGGFSQGAALSLAAGLRYPHKLGAIIMVSGWAALQSEYPGCIAPENANTPVWAMHGDEDGVVLTENLANVKQLLEGLSVPVKTTLFEGAHQLPEDFHLAAFLDEVVPTATSS